MPEVVICAVIAKNALSVGTKKIIRFCIYYKEDTNCKFYVLKYKRDFSMFKTIQFVPFK